jgi:RNA polymerase II subunit A small phosphatase-like protein
MQTDKRILLILDLDETLVHATKTELDRQADFIVFNYHIYKRPFLDQFIRFCSGNFRLAIWSSASDDYVEEVVKRIIPDDIKLDFVWGRSKCTYSFDVSGIETDGYVDYANHYNYIKALKKLKKKGYNLKKVLIVDDTPFKCKRNYGNAIYPKGFLGSESDDELNKLTVYLGLLKDVENVREIEKRGWGEVH